MPQPTPSDLHVDHLLTNISVMYIQDQAHYIADKVFPNVPVAKQSDLYAEFPRGFFFRDEVKPRPLGGRAEVAGYEVTTASYRCEEFALAHKIDDRIRANADQPLDPDRAAVKLLTQQMLIHREKQFMTDFWGTGKWTTDRAGNATPTGDQFLFWDNASANPINDVEVSKETVMGLTGFMPNVLAIGPSAWRVLKNNADVIDRVKYTQRGVVDEDLVASMMGLDKIVVARAIENTAAEGATDVMAFITGATGNEQALLCYVPPSPMIEHPSAGYTFSWTGLIAGATNAYGGVIQRAREDLAHSDHIEVRASWDMKLVSADLGVFFDNIIT